MHICSHLYNLQIPLVLCICSALMSALSPNDRLTILRRHIQRIRGGRPRVRRSRHALMPSARRRSLSMAAAFALVLIASSSASLPARLRAVAEPPLLGELPALIARSA